MAASSVPAGADNIQSRIECPVCCEIFRTPKCLTCGHSVCADCCQKLLPLLGNSISCPVCRRPTAVPATGLPTNFALQDLIQHYENRDDQKRYRCVECDRQCTADEAWISNVKTDPDPSPRCFRCIIVKHSGNEAAAAALPTAMESVTDAFKRHDDELSKLRRRMETFSAEQRDWANNVQQSTWTMKSRVDDIVQASRALVKTSMEDVDKLNNELQLLNVRTDSVHVPRSLEDWGDFNNSIKDTDSKLDELAEARRRTITRANVALNSLAIGLDCLLNAGDDPKGDQKSRNDDGTASSGEEFVTPPQERAVQPKGATASSAMVSQSPSTPGPSSRDQGQPPPGHPIRDNVFSVPAVRGGRYRVVAVRVRRGRGHSGQRSSPNQ